jgi:hypothetical protein
LKKTICMAQLVLLILAFSWVLPDHFPPWTAFHTEVPAFAAAVLAMLATWRWGRAPIRLPAVTFLALGLVLSAFVQWAAGLVLYGGDVLVVAIYIGTLVAAWVCGYQWVITGQKTNLVELTSGLLVVVGLLTSLQVLAQWLQVEGAFGGWVLGAPLARKPYGNVGQPNHAATILLMGAAGAAILMQRGRIRSIALWGTVLMLGFAITVTQSRTALLAATLMVALFSFAYRPADHGPLTRASVLLWLLYMYAAAWGFQNLDWTATKAGIGVGNMVASGSRSLIWSQLVAGLMESPWWGYGWLQVGTGQQVGVLSIPGQEQATFAHNIVLDLFVFLGIPLATVVVGIVVAWWWRRASRIQGSSNAAQAFFILIPFLIHSLLEFPHAYAYFLVVAGLLMGGIDAWSEGDKPWVKLLPKKALAGFIAVWLLVLAATGYEYALAEEDFRVNRFENRKLGVTPSEYQPPDLLLLTQLRDMLKGMRLRAKPGMSTEDIETLVKISKRYSWAPLQFRTALALGLNNRPDEATQQLRVIKGLFANVIYLEAKENFMRLQLEQYPELSRVEIP